MKKNIVHENRVSERKRGRGWMMCQYNTATYFSLRSGNNVEQSNARQQHFGRSTTTNSKIKQYLSVLYLANLKYLKMVSANNAHRAFSHTVRPDTNKPSKYANKKTNERSKENATFTS